MGSRVQRFPVCWPANTHAKTLRHYSPPHPSSCKTRGILGEYPSFCKSRKDPRTAKFKLAQEGCKKEKETNGGQVNTHTTHSPPTFHTSSCSPGPQLQPPGADNHQISRHHPPALTFDSSVHLVLQPDFVNPVMLFLDSCYQAAVLKNTSSSGV